MLPKVFRVLCALDPKGHQYQKPLLEQMLLLKFHELQGTPTWSLLRKHFHLFNEEVGEISLSVLNRLQKPVLNKKPDVEHWDKQYKLSKVYQSIDDSVTKNARDKSGLRSRPIKITKHAETIQKTQVFLDNLIRAAGNGTFTMLSLVSGPTLATKKWDSKRYKANKWKKETPVARTRTSPMFKKDISNILENRWRLVGEDTGSDWAAKQMADSWPEFAVGLDAPVGENVEEPAEEPAEEEGDDEVGGGMDNADEGDDDGEFVLPGLEDASEASEESGEEEGLRTIQEHEEYMAEFVNVSDEVAERIGGEGSTSESESSEEVRVPAKNVAKSGKRQRV